MKHRAAVSDSEARPKAGQLLAGMALSYGSVCVSMWGEREREEQNGRERDREKEGERGRERGL